MECSERVGDFLQCFRGGRFWPLDPRPEEVFVEDIAHALSNQCRYGGHCREFFSVAQHSVIVSHECDPESALWGLLHDAAEAYLADIPRPLKVSFPEYRLWEENVMWAVCSAFGLPVEQPADVKVSDDAVLAAEAYALMGPLDPDWDRWLSGVERSTLPVVPCWCPREAESRFLARYHELSNELSTVHATSKEGP